MDHYAGNIDEPQKCSYCKNPATKGYIWADGRAYIPVCEDHRNKVKKQIEKINDDEVMAVRDIPQEKPKSANLEIPMNPRTAFEQALEKQGVTELKEIKINWDDPRSITKAEREKLRLENAGYSLVQTEGGFTTTTLIYKRKGQALKQAMEFPTEEAKAEYLKEHPGADKAKHTVKKTEEPSKGKEKPSGDEEKRKREEEEFGPENFTPAEHHKDTGRKLREWQSPDSPTLTEVGASFANGKPVPREKLLGAARELKALKDDPVADEHDKKDLDRLAKYLTDLYEQDEPKAKKRKKSASIRMAFEHALLIERVAMEFPSEEAKADYLKAHPGADKSKHTVKKEKGSSTEAKDDFSDLPKDLTKLTKTQTEKVISHMVKWPLKKLRKHQDLVNKQIEKAHGDKNDKALSNLRVQQKHLDAAVNKKEFGD